MKQGMTIQDAAKEIMRQSQAKADYLVNTANLHMETCDGIPILRLLDESGVDRVEPLDILTTAHRQMSAYLNIPWKYYERMHQEDIGLLAQNVNTWLRKGPEQRMIRTIDGRARAFLSNRYRRIDNIDIARITLPIIQQMPDAIYESCNLSDDYMFIKVVNPRLTAEVVPGDIVQAGVVISNSETGQGAVCVQPLIYRLVCSNGMVVNEARTRRNHIGRVTSADENLLIYSEATLRADDKAFVMKVQDTVRAAVDEARFTKILDKLRESKDKKTVITRTFEEVTGKEIRRIHQVPLAFTPEEEAVYNIVMKEFHKVQREYFASTGNSRKDAMLRLMQQITLMLRVAAAPNTLKEYYGDTPLKIMTAVEMAAQWEQEIVAIGVRHQNVLNAYAKAFREYLPDRPLFTVTGSTRTFAQRRALRKTLRDSGNGILLCTQQSLPSSVNFEYVNKILIPEMHFNNSGMSQFYMRFIRFTSKEYKDIYFLNYTGSLESNLLQMVMAKEKINLFMKGQDTDLDQIYEKFGVDYNLLALLMRREVDEEGKFQIRWGDQQIA